MVTEKAFDVKVNIRIMAETKAMTIVKVLNILNQLCSVIRDIDCTILEEL